MLNYRDRDIVQNNRGNDFCYNKASQALKAALTAIYLTNSSICTLFV